MADPQNTGISLYALKKKKPTKDPNLLVGMMAHTCNLYTHKAEAGDLQFPGVHRETVSETHKKQHSAQTLALETRWSDLSVTRSEQVDVNAFLHTEEC